MDIQNFAVRIQELKNSLSIEKCPKDADLMANSADPHQEQADVGLAYMSKYFKRFIRDSVMLNVFQEVEYQGVKFPSQLDTPYAVAQVLNQEPGKLRAKDLRDGKIVFERTED